MGKLELVNSTSLLQQQCPLPAAAATVYKFEQEKLHESVKVERISMMKH